MLSLKTEKSKITVIVTQFFMINRAYVWLHEIGRQDLLEKSKCERKKYRVCSHHFESCMFANYQHNRLLETAVPTLALPDKNICSEIVQIDKSESLYEHEMYIDPHVYKLIDTSEKTDYVQELNAQQNLLGRNICDELMQSDKSESLYEHIMYIDQHVYNIIDEFKNTNYLQELNTQHNLTENKFSDQNSSPLRQKFPSVSHHDMSVQTSFRLSSSTPRKNFLRKKLRTLKMSHRKLKHKVKRLNSNEIKLKNNFKKDLQIISKLSSKYLKPKQHNFFISQLVSSQINTYGIRYTKQDKTFALQLYFKSPAAYRMLKDMFKLPSKTTLTNWLSNSRAQPGIDDTFFKAVQCKVKNMSDRDRTCVLLMDEISIKSNLQYNAATDRIEGFEDYGNTDRTRHIVSSVLVFMLRGLALNWKQAMTFYFISTSCPAKKIKEIMFQFLTKCNEIGVNVVAVLSDQGSNFSQLINLLSITVQQPNFEHDSKKYYYIIDPPHLLKSTRNNLKKHTFIFDNKSASWLHMRNFFNYDSKQKFRLAHKLTKRHIDLPGFSKMSVKLAAQTLSASVSAGIGTLVQFNAISNSASDTADLATIINNLWDSINNSCRRSGNQYKCAMTDTSYHSEYYKKMIEWFDKLKVIDSKGKDVTKQIKCITGWKISLSAINQLWYHLRDNYNFQFLLTRRLNQDPLENFFSVIRHKGGSCDNPTPSLFCKLFRQIFSMELMTVSDSANCEADNDAFLLMLGDMRKLKSKQANINNGQVVPDEAVESDLVLDVEEIFSGLPTFVECWSDTNISLPEENACCYVFGYLLDRLEYIHGYCITCKSHLQLSIDTVEDPKQVYTWLRAYPTNKTTSVFGKLKLPSETFYTYISNSESILYDYFTIHAHETQLVTLLIQQLSQLPLKGICDKYPKDDMIKFFCKLRIDYILKFSNRDFINCPKKQRKLFKIQSM